MKDDPRVQRLAQPVDSGGGPPHDGDMEARVTKLESELTAIKIDLAVIKASCATKTDIAELKTDLAETKTAFKSDIAEAQTKIIMWVVTAIFLAQLLPLVRDFIRSDPSSGNSLPEKVVQVPNAGIDEATDPRPPPK